MSLAEESPIKTPMLEINVLLPKEELEGMPRRERKKQETRWRIYEAAFALFAKQDYDSVKIEEICAAADVSNAAFFHHFSNKASLIRAYIEKLKANIQEQLEALGTASSTEKLELISREVAKTGETAAFAAQVFGAVASSDAALDMEHIDTGITGTLTEIIREGQASGEFRENWQAELVAASLVGSWLILPLAAKSPAFPKMPHIELMKLMLTGLKN
jgi:AcrR family transcriptional regulator